MGKARSISNPGLLYDGKDGVKNGKRRQKTLEIAKNDDYNLSLVK